MLEWPQMGLMEKEMVILVTAYCRWAHSTKEIKKIKCVLIRF